MQRILLISDIHGNYPALQAVEKQADLSRCDAIINCGDCTVYAPFANQVMTWLHRHTVISIRGNTDSKVMKLLKGKTFKKPGKKEKRIMYTHTATDLSKENQKQLKQLRKKECIQTGNWKIGVFHGSPADPNEFLFATTPDKRFRDLGETFPFNIIITGHSHTPYYKLFNTTHFINPGSVGRMFDGIPKASFAMLYLHKKKIQVTHHRCSYNIQEVTDALTREHLPEIYKKMYQIGKKLN